MQPQGAPNVVAKPELDLADHLGAIRAYYHESLYLSRTPLTYFVKGPLSRARAAARQEQQSSNLC